MTINETLQATIDAMSPEMRLNLARFVFGGIVAVEAYISLGADHIELSPGFSVTKGDDGTIRLAFDGSESARAWSVEIRNHDDH